MYFAAMRLVPVLFPCDLGRSQRGQYVVGGCRGAPDRLLDGLESEGVRLAAPVTVAVDTPTDAAPESTAKFAKTAAQAVERLAEVVESINAASDFPLVLGGDHLGMLGHVLGHSRRFPQGIGLAVLSDAFLDLEIPGPPAYDDPEKRRDPLHSSTGDLCRMVLSAALGRWPDDEVFIGGLARQCRVKNENTSVLGIRAPASAMVSKAERSAHVDVWTMERLELDGESAYRSVLNRHLAWGPIALSVDVSGLDSHLMNAVSDPVPDGLEWGFLKRSLDQCLPHVDRILGLDICEVDPTRDDAHQGSLVRFAETLAPFLRRLSR
ncbi:MAG: arginase family protein [Myxococcota bacterium]